MLEWFKSHPLFFLLATIQIIALGSITILFAALFRSTFNGEDCWLWFAFLDMPLLIFVIWVWWKAIMPWTNKIICDEEFKYLKKQCDNETD